MTPGAHLIRASLSSMESECYLPSISGGGFAQHCSPTPDDERPKHRVRGDSDRKRTLVPGRTGASEGKTGEPKVSLQVHDRGSELVAFSRLVGRVSCAAISICVFPCRVSRLHAFHSGVGQGHHALLRRKGVELPCVAGRPTQQLL